MTEELTQLLALLMEPVGANPWLVDWLWDLYKEALQPFLVLAGPASDGAAVMRFRECWACLPWGRATFHCISPGQPTTLHHPHQRFTDLVSPCCPLQVMVSPQRRVKHDFNEG